MRALEICEGDACVEVEECEVEGLGGGRGGAEQDELDRGNEVLIAKGYYNLTRRCGIHERGALLSNVAAVRMHQQ